MALSQLVYQEHPVAGVHLRDRLIAATLLRIAAWVEFGEAATAYAVIKQLCESEMDSIARAAGHAHVAMFAEAEALLKGSLVTTLTGSRTQWTYAVVWVLFSAENGRYIDCTGPGDELGVALTVMRDAMDHKHKRDPDRQFNKKVQVCAMRLRDALVAADVFVYPMAAEG